MEKNSPKAKSRNEILREINAKSIDIRKKKFTVIKLDYVAMRKAELAGAKNK